MPDTDDPRNRQSIENYKLGIIQRNAQRVAAPPATPIPNLVEAEAMHDTERDGPKTLADMAVSQQEMRGGKAPEKPTFSSDTVAGLRALKEQSDAHRLQQPPQPEHAPPQPVEEPSVSEDDESFVAQNEALQAFNTDVDTIKNEAERKRIDEIVEPIDINEGFANGVFTQHVPIVPGRFEVTFKTASSEELQRVRLEMVARIDKEPHLELVSGQLLALMTLVAQIEAVNGRKEDPHMVGESLYSANFNKDAFNRKVDRYLRYPGPMVYSMSVHCDWFQDRVRKCFTAENLKNG